MANNKQKKEIVSFMKERTFGDIIGAPFQFIIQEFKFFAGILLRYAGPFVAVILLTVALIGNDLYNAATMSSDVPASTGVYALIAGLAFFLGYVSVLVVTHSYITLYVNKGRGNFSRSEVGELLKKNIGKIIGAGFLMFLMIFVGMLLFYIPGIYLAVALSFVFIIIIYENKGAGNAISRSFEVIKGKWWQTLGLILVFGMIIGVSSYVFIIPIYAVVIVAAVSGSQIGTGSVVFIILFVFLYFTAYLFFMAMQQILIAFQYFNLRAQKDGLLLQDRIAAINNDEKTEEKEKPTEEKQKETEENPADEEIPKEKNRFTDNDDDIDRFKPKY